MSSPFLRAHPSATPSLLRLALTAALFRIAPAFVTSSGIDSAAISHDPEVVRAYVEDPLVSRKVSAGWYRAALAAQKEVNEGAARFAVPVLVMASGEDRLVDPLAIREWASRAPADRTTFVEWPGFFHEMFNEVGNEQVLTRVVEWLEARLN